MEQKKALNRKKLKVILVICIVMIVTAGIGLAAYIHHVDTVTLGRKVSVYRLDVSKLTVGEAQQKISEAFQNKTITFHEEGKDVYNVSMEQLGYSLDQDTLKSALETLKQERSGTFKLFASQRDYKIDYQIIRDEAQEQAALSADHFDEKDRTEPTDAHIRYSKKKQKYVLVKQVSGNQIDENRLLSYVEETLDKDFETELLTSDVKMELNEEVYRQPDIEESGEMKQKVKKLNSLLKKYRSTTVSYLFGEETLDKDFETELLTSDVKMELNEEVYRQPDIEESGEMKQKVKKLNSLLKKYRSTTVSYLFGEETQVLDSDTISSWLRIKNSGISIDKDAAADYISNMANKYNTIYVPRTFHTSLGTDVTVSDNEYGYRIDQDAELTQLLEDLKSGENVSREPVYSSSGMKRNGTDDLAGSYIEFSLDSQHLWLYKDGALVTETDIVSGAPTPERETYRGAWPIAYKASPFTLSSEEYGYAETVKYWMPFVYGQGLHDASWQSAFGGNRYKTGHGSHGCINLPEDQAALIYNTIDGGYPIIIY